MNNKKKILQFIVVLLLVVLVFEIFYLSWLPNGHLGKETYLPSWLLEWSNVHYNLRTALPFFVLSFLLEAWHAMNASAGKKIKKPFCVFNIGIATVFVCFVEIGQFFVLNRHPDSIDVLYGILGSIAGCMLYYCSKRLNRKIILKG